MVHKNDFRLVAFLSYNIYVKYNLKILTFLHWKLFIWQICVWVWLHRSTWKKENNSKEDPSKEFTEARALTGHAGMWLKEPGLSWRWPPPPGIVTPDNRRMTVLRVMCMRWAAAKRRDIRVCQCIWNSVSVT